MIKINMCSIRFKAVLGLLLVGLVVAYAVFTINRGTKFLLDSFWRHLPIYQFQTSLGNYYLAHGHAPLMLSVLVPEADQRNDLWFGTRPGWRCRLRYTPQAAKKGGAVAYFRCGDPVLYEVWILADGMVMRERKYPDLRWRARRQERARPTLYVRDILAPYKRSEKSPAVRGSSDPALE